MPDSAPSLSAPRVRFAPSPTGYLHVGGARTFIFNWLYARHTGGTLVLRLDDTDVERNTEASVQSIFEGLRWLGLNWDEEYKQSERLPFTANRPKPSSPGAWPIATSPPPTRRRQSSRPRAHGSSTPACANSPSRKQPPRRRRRTLCPPLSRPPRRKPHTEPSPTAVYGEQSKQADEVEDFALLRSDGFPTYHLASCADDADLRISHIIRGQDHLTNTFKHLLIFEALGAPPPGSPRTGLGPWGGRPKFAHLPLLVAPDGAKLSKRKHGPVVSVTTYRDAGFLPAAFVNFLCLLGWSPKDDREFLTLDELTAAFTLENVNRSNAVINFSDDDPFDPKAVWLNAEHIRALPFEELSRQLEPFFEPGRLRSNTRKTPRP